ncbi:twin-arginine translocase TatA/TatE family subunit [Streptomyces sp. NPDC088400]|uniref:twin-arginine translocase TatA/TatE family subunit n=1 Tax=Streptomyces sp. NPDC088400 TaxID=3365861 RepID=UPI003823D297
MFGIGEVALILIIIVLVLGAKKLPELARSAGKSARILKSEAKALKEDGKAAQESGSGSATGQADGAVTGGAGREGEPRIVTGTIVERDDQPARP